MIEAVPGSLGAFFTVVATVPAILVARFVFSIGYDEPHGKVEGALKKAAESMELAEPFVFVDELLERAVDYCCVPEAESTNGRFEDIEEEIRTRQQEREEQRLDGDDSQ